jgi:hypothetical protein
MDTLELTDDDLRLVAALAQAEGGSLLGDGVAPEDAFGLPAWVVANRAATSGKSVRDVIGAPSQFEPVADFGGVDNLPPASDDTLAAVRAALSKKDSPYRKATNFANPWASGKKALGSWLQEKGGYPSWPRMGKGKNVHVWNSLFDVPDYGISLTGADVGAGLSAPGMDSALGGSEQGLANAAEALLPAGNAGSMADLGAIGDAGGLAASMAGTGVPWADIAMMAAGMLGQMGQPDPAAQQAQEVSQRAAQDATQQRQQYAARNGWGWG